ncbi:uncharacterized protein LOC131597482 [Vicia villosa]|uniref:uncharacterized protein LOC131597482 n=1 Tax=Vicia villosa TaxID=3911 RepID=UPI00273AE6B8|nr:uncharacterized protein LOC131597482 [Vicia villosa]
MEDNTDLVQEPTRHTRAYKIPTTNVSELKRLSSHLTGNVFQNFNISYDNLLSILKTSFDLMALITLLQFYDQKLCYFTFQDYQLVPTLKEYSYLINIKIADEFPFARVLEVVKFEVIAEALHLSLKDVKNNWKTSGDDSGFYLSFLVNKVGDLPRKGNWGDFNLLFALMWLMTLLLTSGPFMNMKGYLQWASRIVNLTSFDIRWNHIMGEVRSIITSCEEYSNVPLMGTKGCINYNPVLFYSQLRDYGD